MEEDGYICILLDDVHIWDVYCAHGQLFMFAIGAFVNGITSVIHP